MQLAEGAKEAPEAVARVMAASEARVETAVLAVAVAVLAVSVAVLAVSVVSRVAAGMVEWLEAWLEKVAMVATVADAERKVEVRLVAVVQQLPQQLHTVVEGQQVWQQPQQRVCPVWCLRCCCCCCCCC